VVYQTPFWFFPTRRFYINGSSGPVGWSVKFFAFMPQAPVRHTTTSGLLLPFLDCFSLGLIFWAITVVHQRVLRPPGIASCFFSRLPRPFIRRQTGIQILFKTGATLWAATIALENKKRHLLFSAVAFHRVHFVSVGHHGGGTLGPPGFPFDIHVPTDTFTFVVGIVFFTTSSYGGTATFSGFVFGSGIF